MLTQLENTIWNKYGWTNGGMVNFEKHKAELRKKVAPKSLSYVYYHIFEDANFHTLNKSLEEMGAFTGTYADAQNDFDEYRKAGGKTWQL